MTSAHLLHKLMLLSCLILFVFSTQIYADPTDGKIEKVMGDAKIILPNGTKSEVTVLTLVTPGSTIQTGEDSYVVVDWTPGAESVISSNTTVAVDSLKYGVTQGGPRRTIGLNLSKGSLYNNLAHNDGQSDFHIKTPLGVAAARGTQWVVRVDDNGAVKVAVVLSAVDVTLEQNLVITVRAGYIFNVSVHGHPVPMTPDEITIIYQYLALVGLVQIPLPTPSGAGMILQEPVVSP